MQVRTTGAEPGRRAMCLICLFLFFRALCCFLDCSSLLIRDELLYRYCVAVMYNLFISFVITVTCNGTQNELL